MEGQHDFASPFADVAVAVVAVSAEAVVGMVETHDRGCPTGHNTSRLVGGSVAP